MQPALVEQEGNEQQDLLNPEKPYEVDEFFKLIAKHPGNCRRAAEGAHGGAHRAHPREVRHALHAPADAAARQEHPT